ncbi:unnamed protein product [Medioppia subpectinata]|uniref:Neurotransmitter-gated ion-channel ligand-binding domain-containing protein n=1 Tax=Medioppia subpectinata TaxID=1979941 RepID=A0A7R9PZ72_9ACAR|nr:unnamed protein product [Medioppia subpectinata]CAG2106153.1 unnamed protein product [Medioppia subpectinata]
MNAHMYFRQKWNDPRLVSQEITADVVGGESLANRVWIPDTFFANSMQVLATKYPMRNAFLMVKPNGDVMHSERLQVLFRCGPKVSMKTDECTLEMESYGFSNLDIKYDWAKANKSVMFASTSTHHNQYKLTQALGKNQMISLSTVGSVKGLKAITDSEIYDKDIRPKLGDGPVQVNISMHVIDYTFDPIKREMNTNMYFRQKWNDPRLVSQAITVDVVGGESLVNRVWIPDTFFANSVEVLANKYPKRNSFLRVEPNGNVFYSEKLRVMFRCGAKVSAKNDECNLEMESYGFSKLDVEYDWTKANRSIGFDPQSILCQLSINSLNPKTAALKAFKEKTSPELYDKTLRPNLTGDPVRINISMYIIDYAFDPIKREMRANMYYRQLWNDPRLVSQNIAVNIIGGQSLVDRVWIPDTFFANSLDVLDNKYPAYIPAIA